MQKILSNTGHACGKASNGSKYLICSTVVILNNVDGQMRTTIITQPPAKIKGLFGRYRQPLRVAFAFLLSPDRPHAISSALLCLLQRSSPFPSR